jgi:uncharacterized protein
MLAAVVWSAALALEAMIGAPLGAAAEGQPRSVASFDCAKAMQWVEKTICSDSALAALDRRLSLVFAEARRELAPRTGKLFADQREWLGERQECSTEEDQPAQAACLSARYEERVRGLIVDLPLLARLRQPVSDPQANQVIGVFHLMTPDDLYDATTDGNRDALAEVSCRFFNLFPKEAAELFKANDYSTRDAWRPLCRTIDVVTQVPATSRLVSVLETIAGNSENPRCLGTMQYGVVRTQMVARIMVVVDAAPHTGARERDRASASDGLSYHANLALWAMQGLWEKRRYADLRRAVAQARPALAADYARRFHLDAARAGRLADDHVQRMIDIYTGQSARSSPVGSYSLCLSTADLDGYLAGKVPDKKCPDTEFADPAPEATLRRLLGLAIVNDYPTQVVRRLIAGGARLDPPGLEVNGEHESRESLLMLAAARADVIDALLAAGADPNRRNEFGKTALMYAVQECNLPGVRRLIRSGADVNAATTVGEECLVVQPGGRTALMYAAWQGTPAIVRALLDAHADARPADSQGKTAADYVDANRRLSQEERRAMKALLPGSQAARR